MRSAFRIIFMLSRCLLGFQAQSLTLLICWMLLMPQFLCNTCPPPDFSERGRYEPMKERYEVGERANYHCHDLLPMYDENSFWINHLQFVICEESGKWNRGTNFCEAPIELKNPITSSKALESALLDDNIATCSPTLNDTTEILRFTLEREVMVFSTIMSWGPGKKKIKIAGSGWESIINTESTFYSIDHYMKTDIKTRSVTVQITSDTASSIPLCNFQVFGKDEEWCLHPPVNFIPNGQLEVSRRRAVLHCNEGFREKYDRKVYATCENNKWSYLILQCIEKICDPDFNNIEPLWGNWESDNQTSADTLGTTRTLKCNPGFYSDGEPLTVTCQADRTWSKSSATCKKKKFQMNYILLAIIVGSMVAIIIIISVGLKLDVFRKKREEVPASYKAGEAAAHSNPLYVGDLRTTDRYEVELSTVCIMKQSITAY